MLSVHVAESASKDVVVAVVGDLTDRTAGPLRDRLFEALAQKPFRLVVDLGQVRTITSIGERLLLEAARAARAQRVTFVVDAGSETLRRRLAENGFDRLVPVLPLPDAEPRVADAAD